MLYNNLKVFIEYNDITVTKGPINDKFLSIFCLSENDDSLSMVNTVGLSKGAVKHYAVPNSLAPFRTYMNSDYKSKIQGSKLIPIKVNFEELSNIKNKHFYVDTNLYLSTVIDRWNIHIFNNRKYRRLFEDYMRKLTSNVPENSEKVLLYSVNLDKEYQNKLLNKKILPIYLTILKNMKTVDEVLPFDKIIFAPYSIENNTKSYYIIYDKEKRVNLPKFRSIITKYEYEEKEEDVDPEINDVINSVTDDDLKEIENFNENFSLWYTGAVISSLDCSDEMITKNIK